MIKLIKKYRVHRNLSSESTPIEMLDINFNVIKQFRTMKEAHEETGIYLSGISNCCNGTASTAGGYRWRRVDSFNNK